MRLHKNVTRLTNSPRQSGDCTYTVTFCLKITCHHSDSSGPRKYIFLSKSEACTAPRIVIREENIKPRLRIYVMNISISDKGVGGILLQNSQLLLQEERSKACKNRIRVCVTVLKHGPVDLKMR